MRQFVYLDTDIIHSIIAQNEKGLVLEMSNEYGVAKNAENKEVIAKISKGVASGGIWKIAQAHAELGLSGETTASCNSQDTLKEIATKTLHDAAFDIACEHISFKTDTTLQNLKPGNFLKLTQQLSFIDLAYIEKILTVKGAFVNFLKKNDLENAKQRFIQNNGANQNKFKEVATTKEIDKVYNDCASTIEAIRQLIPYNRMLISQDYFVIPLEDKYFRDNPQTMGFKHGGAATCIGYITNIVDKTSSPTSESIFSLLHTQINQSLPQLIFSKNCDFGVIHPVAIYYDEDPKNDK